MVDNAATGATSAPRRWWRYLLFWPAIGLAVMLLLSVLLVQASNTQRGRAFIASQLHRIAPESGLTIGVGRLDGSLFGRLIITDLRLGDPRGVFLVAPRVELDWDPSRFLANRLQLSYATADTVRLLRRPMLNDVPRDPDEPLLPGFDIYVGRLAIANLILEAPVTGRRDVLGMTARADIQDGRVFLDMKASARGGGDALLLTLDAIPDRDRFDIAARLSAPTGGVVTSLLRLQAPLAITVEGDGRWQRWQGSMRGTLGAASLADLTLRADEGRFRLAGTAAPALLFRSNMLRRLTAPGIELSAQAELIDNRLRIGARAITDALTLDIEGSATDSLSELEDLRIDFALRQPQALQRNLGGERILMRLNASGHIRGPRVSYAMTADRFAVTTTVLEQLDVRGEVDLAQRPVTIPVAATANRVSGVPELVGELVTNLRATGKLRLQNGLLVSRDLAIRSDRINATATLVVTPATSRYVLDLDGRLPAYVLSGVGRMDVSAKVRVTPNAQGQMLVSGPVAVGVTRLDSGLFNALFEGRPSITGQILRTPDGVIGFSNARLVAPGMTATASGRFLPDNSIDMRASGRSRTYGAFTAQIIGPITRPRVVARLPRYTAGLELTAIDARLDPVGDDYRFDVTAASMVGPITANGLIRTTTDPVAIELAALQGAGLTASGTLRQAEAGPFAGTLAVAGPGTTGTAILSSAGNAQRILVAADFRNASLLDPEPVMIRDGRLEADIVAGDAPAVRANFAARNVSRGTLRVRTVEGTAAIVDGRGTARLSASGDVGQPFTLEASGDFGADRITVAASGTVDGKPLRLGEPAVLERDADGWRLERTVVELPKGRATVGGRFGETIALDAALADVDLEIANLVRDDLGLAGTASGTVTLALAPGAALPTGTVKLVVRGLSRATLGASARPFDLGVNAVLSERSAGLRAVFQRNKRLLGRAQFGMPAIAGNAGMTSLERLLASPVTGQVRWASNAAPLWALAQIDALDVRGPLAMALDIGGTLGDPRINGTIVSNGLRMESTSIGTIIEDVNLNASFSGARLSIDRFVGKAGENGSITVNGFVDVSAERGFPMQLDIALQRALLANRDDLRATLSGPVRVSNGTATGSRITGELVVDRALFRLGTGTSAQFAEIEVQERNTDMLRAGVKRPQQQRQAATTAWQIDLKVDANNKVEVRGLGLDSEWSLDIGARGAVTQPRLSGRAQLVRGEYDFAGKKFKLERGNVRFTGNWPLDPIIDIRAESNVEGLTARINIGGTAQTPQIALSSVPALPEDEVIARLLFGSSVADLSAPEALQLAGAVAALRSGGTGALDPIGAVRNAVGLDRLRFGGGDEERGSSASVTAGEYLADRVYVEVAADDTGYAATQLEVELTRSLSILSTLSSLGDTSVNLRWSRDY